MKRECEKIAKGVCVMKISIVVPVYNLENYIPAIIESLKAQTYKGYEVLFVDDGSSDGGPQLIQDAVDEMDGKFKLYSIENSGVSAARNYGLAQATGDYVLFVDGDDYLAANCIEEIVSQCTVVKPDIICWAYDEVDEKHSVSRSYSSRYAPVEKRMKGIEALSEIILYKTMNIGTGSAAYNRSFLLENGLLYAAGCSNGEDQEFIYKALSKTNNVLFLNKVLSFYLQRLNSISNSYDIRKFEVVYALERAYHFMESDLSPALKKAYKKIFIGNYLYNLDSCLKNSRLRNIKMILSEVDAEYPSLNRKMLAAMKAYESENTVFMWRIKLFLMSPYVYIVFKRAENKIENY